MSEVIEPVVPAEGEIISDERDLADLFTGGLLPTDFIMDDGYYFLSEGTRRMFAKRVEARHARELKAKFEEWSEATRKAEQLIISEYESAVAESEARRELLMRMTARCEQLKEALAEAEARVARQIRSYLQTAKREVETDAGLIPVVPWQTIKDFLARYQRE